MKLTPTLPVFHDSMQSLRSNGCVRSLKLYISSKFIINNIKMLFKSLAIVFLCTLPAVFGVRCYQCASSQDNIKMGEDNCGAYKKFDKQSHIAVECGSDESHMPGAFCMKLTRQGPKGFVWDGRWRQVIRRCASVTETGVTGVCNWGVYDNGVYWEECYCSADECNGASFKTSSLTLLLCLSAMIFGSKLI